MAGSLVGAIAVLLLLVSRLTGGSGDKTSTGVTIYRVGRTTSERLTPNASVDRLTTYAAGYRNIPAGGAYFLVFAVDSASTTHWLYPQFDDPRVDPPPVKLAESKGETQFPTLVELDKPALGPLRIVSLITTDAVRVSAIDSLPAPELSSNALHQRFPTAIIDELVVTVEKAKSP